MRESGPNDLSVRFQGVMDRQNYCKEICIDCGAEFGTHISAVMRAQRRGGGLCCGKCYAKGLDEIHQAAINLDRRKKECIGAARKLTDTMKWKGRH